MAISFSFITALAPKIEYRFWWILAVGWIALAVCIILNIDNYLWGKYNTDNDQERYDETQRRSREIYDKNRKLDNRYNRPTAWLMIGGITFILGFVFVNLVFNSPKQHQLREKTTTHAISSIEKTSNGLKVIQQDTLSSHQIKETL